MTIKLTKEQEDYIRSYSSRIATMPTFVEIVRRRPGMFIGDVGNRGFINMWREVFQNAIDQMVKAKSPCDTIYVSFDERTKTVINEDNGLGIPFNDIIRIFTKEWTSTNYEKEEGDFSAGMNGVGAKVTNALSSEFIVESFVLGEARKVVFTDGVPGKTETIPNEGKQGTRITFRPSFDCMGEITVTAADIRDLVVKIISLTKIGSKVQFSYIRSNGQPHSETIVNTDGIISNLIMKTEAPIIAPIAISVYTGTMTCDVAFTYDSEAMSEQENITSFANFCPTESGTHVDGFIDGISKFLRDYMNKIYLVNNNKVTITTADVKTGLKCVLSVMHLDPIFAGQAKEVLRNLDIKEFVKNTVIDGMDNWMKNNPNDVQKVARYLKDVAELRMKVEEGKIKIAKSYTANLITGLPDGYRPPKGGKGLKLEFVITEGKSAANEEATCPFRQGIFPIRGKMPNAFTTDKQKYLGNKEVGAIIDIMGCGYGKSFDITKIKWDKFIMATDADADGAHIRTLILSLLLLYMIDLLIHGLVYAAVPPLYGVENKNGKWEYFTDKYDFVTYVQKLFSKGNVIMDIAGRKMNTSDVINFLFRNIDYLYEINNLARRYSVDPKLLEFALANYKNPKSLDKNVKMLYRFVNAENKNGQMVLSGLVGSKYNTLVLGDKLLSESTNALKHIYEINDGNILYQLNGNTASVYDIMSLYDKTIPPGQKRFKGLGEMDPEQLSESTLHPDGNRTLIRYTVDDAKAELEAIRKIQFNKSSLMTGLNISRHDIE